MSSDRLRLMATAVLFGLAVPAAAQSPLLGPEVERVVNAPEGASFVPDVADESDAMGRVASYTMALARRDFASAYAMLRLSRRILIPAQPQDADDAVGPKRLALAQSGFPF